MDASTLHTPVMLERCLELLAPAASRDGAVVIDATLGLGGHTEALLERHAGLTVVGIDRDVAAIDLARERLARFGDRLRIVHATYDEIEHALDEAGVRRLDGVLFDLGVSSMQLDEPGRGFSYSKDAPLDMRMDRDREGTAAELVATASERELADLMHRYGDERLARRYARAIVRSRESEAIETSAQLVAIIDAATPAAARRSGHSAKRVFQALRIAVNDELGVLERAMPAALDALDVDGRIVVLAYQSLEDRIVKRALRDATMSTTPVDVPAELPDHAPRFELLVRGAELADEQERATNPRSIPVRLRAAARIRERDAARASSESKGPA